MSYLADMAIFPRPVSPKRAWVDLRDYLAEGRRHKLLLLALALAMTWVIIWGFLLDSKTNTAPGKQIIYIENWTGDRTDADIIAQQKIDLLKREAAIKRKQQDFRKVADQFGIDWRKEAAIGDRREKEAVAALMKRLDKMEAEAKAKAAEKAGKSGAAH
ncbi:hypothetical protein [Rhizorhapis suberifaciens]|uniref:Uncharacterized protein n=1 Tax=Rhizorhapis suberifaciens TaxID=13656 RepID=A0A840HSQ0_9SPHN|nr:hypothetical protein [Rhizorhapis suberifaciens]MBB4640953.1 hypothetical protein [Rhizorhapis suberifaciens]